MNEINSKSSQELLRVSDHIHFKERTMSHTHVRGESIDDDEIVSKLRIALE